MNIEQQIESDGMRLMNSSPSLGARRIGLSEALETLRRRAVRDGRKHYAIVCSRARRDIWRLTARAFPSSAVER
jgi:hypothetical protein